MKLSGINIDKAFKLQNVLKIHFSLPSTSVMLGEKPGST